MFILCIILATAKTAEAAVTPVSLTDAAPCTISVVFENGLNTINKVPGNNFTISINITNSPNMDFFDIGIQWNPSVLELKTGTPMADVVEGGFMKAFGATAFPGPSPVNTNLIAGIMSDIPCGFSSGGPAHGNGTLFKVAFHCKAPDDGNITIMKPNVISVLLLGMTMVNIDATVNGSVIVIPEFSASVLLPLFLVITTIAIAAATVSSRKRRIPSRIS